MKLSFLCKLAVTGCLIVPGSWAQSPAEKPARVQLERSALSAPAFEARAIAAERVVTIEGQHSELVTAANLQARLLAGGVFVESGARTAVTRTAVPEVLRAHAAKPAAAFRLSYDVVLVDQGMIEAGQQQES
jgi:hypothetical protein